MDAEVRPATPTAGGPTLGTAFEHPFVVPGFGAGPSSESTSQLPNGEQQITQESASTTILPRLASVHTSHNGSQSDTEPLGMNGPEEPLPNVTVPETDSTRRNSGSFSGNVLRGDSLMDEEVVDNVLTPSRLRLDSRVVMAHATLQWLTNAIWAMLIWQKLDGRLHCSWWAVFSPTIVNHVLHIPMQLIVLRLANYMVYKQIGPPPPPSATPGLMLQYAIMQHVRVRSHRVDWANNALESTAVFVVKMLFCDALQRDTLGETSLRLIFTPIWACWVLTFLLLCLKDRSERMLGSSRDLFFIFLLFVAFKVDEQSNYAWRVVFLVPWMWFSGLLLAAALVFLLLLFAKVWARPRDLLLPIGFLLLLLSSIPQFVSYIALVRRLDGDTDTSIASIMWPNALSWLLMWLSAAVMATALRQKEAVRDALLARGAVWTAHEGVARGLHEEQQRVDELSEEEIARRVKLMMAGKSKPGRLRRVGENLYKRIASLEPALKEQPAAGSSSAPASPTASTTAAGAGGGVPCPSGAGPGGLEPPPSPPLAPGGDSSVRPRRDSGGGGAAPAAGVGGGGSGLGLFRHNRVVPLGRSAGSQAGPVGAVSAGAAAAAAAAAAVMSPRGLDGPSDAAGTGEAASASTASAPAPAAPTQGAAAVAADCGALASRGSVITMGAVPARMRSGRSNSWMGRAGGAAAGGPALVPSLELTRLEEGRDLECASASFRDGSRASRESLTAPPPTQTQISSSSRPPSQAQTQIPGVPSPPGADEPTGSSAAGAASIPGQMRGRPAPQLTPRQRPESAAAAPASTVSATAAALVAAEGSTAASSATGSSGSDVAAAATQQRVRSASTRAAIAAAATQGPAAVTSSAAAAAPAAAAGSNPRRSPALTEEGDAAASPRSSGSWGTSSRRSGTSSSTDTNDGNSIGAQAQPAKLAKVWVVASSSSLPSSSSFARRARAVLPPADADPEVDLEAPKPGTGPGAAETKTAAAAAAAAGAGGDAGASSDAPASPARSEREDVSNLSPAAPDSHSPFVEGSGAGGGAAAAAVTTADELDPDNTCVICYDGEATCVFLECGHGGFCRRCAFLLFVRPPNECPTCRAPIDQVVEIESTAAVGQVANVK